MKHRETFIEWLMKQDYTPTDIQKLVAMKLDEDVAHFMIESFGLRCGKTFILKEFEKYVKEKRNEKYE